MNKHSKAIIFLRNRDKIIRNLILIVGPCTLRPSSDYYKSLVRSIISQQLSNQAARTIYLRFLNELNGDITPQKVIGLHSSSFRRAGISRQKASYLCDLAQKFVNRELDVDIFRNSDDQVIIDSLTKIRGIGTWSAKMFLIFCLNRQDVLPLEDVGFRRAVMKNYGLSKMPNERKIRRIAQNWGNYKSIAVWYLWQSVNT